MLTPYSRSQFVTKILTSDTGEKFQVVFLVTLVNGEVKGQIISATPIAEATSICLPVSIKKSPVTFTYTAPSNPAVSPFNSLFFFNSQPTRAPSF